MINSLVQIHVKERKPGPADRLQEHTTFSKTNLSTDWTVLKIYYRTLNQVQLNDSKHKFKHQPNYPVVWIFFVVFSPWTYLCTECTHGSPALDAQPTPG
jgi:hypothetical protein